MGIKDQFQELKGKAKEQAGRMTDNPDLEASGKKDQVAGKTKDGLDNAKNSATEKLNNAADSVTNRNDRDDENNR
jgi:uncharacterized protein YjbJ (UPF0337 family)